MPRATKRPDLRPSILALEPTFSPEEVGAHLGLEANAMAELVRFGRTYGAALHPTRGGLWPTFRGAKLRRIPLSAIDRHKRHMARVSGEAVPPATLLIKADLVTAEVPREVAA